MHNQKANAEHAQAKQYADQTNVLPGVDKKSEDAQKNGPSLVNIFQF